MNNNKISIVAASDNHYAILIAALLKSMEINHLSKECIDFYIIDDGISSKNRQKISASVLSDKIRLCGLRAKN